MRLGSPHGAVHRLARSAWPRQRLVVQLARSWSSTRPRRYPGALVIKTDEPPYRPQPEPNPKAKDVAVIGAGITGLATAFNLVRTLPDAKITIYEEKDRLGGWLDSDIVPVDGGEIIFEWGPRTLRIDNLGAGRYTTNLLSHLSMADDIVATSQHSPAARNRYIYYPDHLVRMPGPLPGASLLMNIIRNVQTLFFEPIFKGLLRGMISEPNREIRPQNLEDESVGDFISRRFGKNVAENLVSALLHGIYAGDLYKLSARTIFPLLWHLENVSEAGILGEMGELMLRGQMLISYSQVDFISKLDRVDEVEDSQLDPVIASLRGASVYTFKRGLQQLADRLEEELRLSSRVQVKTKHKVQTLRWDPSADQIRLGFHDDQIPEEGYDYAVSTLSYSTMGKLINLPGVMPPNDIPSVNVMVVNLYFERTDLLNVRGFGYLLPRSVALEQNPERALGVIFGSETSVGQDTAPGTKVTVMLGGHWWDGWKPSDLPDEESAVAMAKSVLERHLHVRDEPVVARAKLATNAIPQYPVGYHGLMSRAHRNIHNTFHGRLKVAGSYFQGAVGVHDCTKSARKAAFDIREGMDENTGLEGYGKKQRWCVFDRRKGEIDARQSRSSDDG